MRGKLILYRDQYGRTYYARTVRELREHAGGGRVSKMYIDGKDGKTYHVGYVIGRLWFDAYAPVRVEV